MDRSISIAAATALDYFLVYEDSSASLKRISGTVLAKVGAPSGAVLQTVYTEVSTAGNGTTAIPNDDTIPQNTEGTQVITASITPSSSSNKILVTFIGSVSHDATSNTFLTAALFRDSVANAIAAEMNHNGLNTLPSQVAIVKQDSPATTSATTYSVRIGGTVGTTYSWNGFSSARKMGGVMPIVLILQEIKG